MSAHQSADAGHAPYDPVVLRYERIHGGALVAAWSNGGRSVVAIVHPHTPGAAGRRRWELAGEVADKENRPSGVSERVAGACAEAAEALGVELGVDVAGYEVDR